MSTSTKKTKTNVSSKAPPTDSFARSIDSEAEAEVLDDVPFVVDDVFGVRFLIVFSHVFDVEDVVIERICAQLQWTLRLSKAITLIRVQLVFPRLIKLAPSQFEFSDPRSTLTKQPSL